MDGERNIVQTVLKANNTFKDFSVSLLRSLSTLAHKHTTRTQTFLSFGQSE